MKINIEEDNGIITCTVSQYPDARGIERKGPKTLSYCDKYVKRRVKGVLYKMLVEKLSNIPL